MILATWNTQGYPFANNQVAKLLGDENIDVLCLQECGALTNIKFRPLENVFIGKWNNYKVIYYKWRRCRTS